MARLQTSLVVLLLASAFIQSAEPAKERRTWATYDVGDLIRKPGAQNGLERVERLADMVMSTVDPAGWREKDGGTLQIRNGNSLEIYTTAKYHGEIADLIEALRRLNDLAVDVKGYLCELDKALFDKAVKSKIGNAQAGGVPLVATLEPAAYQSLRDQLRIVTSHKVRIANGREGEFLSLEYAERFGIRTKQDKDAKAPGAVFPGARAVKSDVDDGTVLHGVKFRASAHISADRRFVRLYLTQQIAELVAVNELPLDEEEKLNAVRQVPQISRSALAATVTAPDGQVLLMPVHYLPRAVKDKGRVWVLVVQPVIYIEAEQRELQKTPALP